VQDPSAEIRAEFIRIVDGLVIRMRDVASDADRSVGDSSRVANLGHRLSDTLPSDLAEQLEELVDDLLTLSGQVWPDPFDGTPDRNAGAVVHDRLDHLGRRWSRLKRNLLSD